MRSEIKTIQDANQIAVPDKEFYQDFGCARRQQMIFEKAAGKIALIGDIGSAIPAVFGFSLRYAADRWPLLEPGRYLSVDEVERLDVKTLLAGPFVEELFDQMETIATNWGKIHGYLHFQGILNNAFHMRGQKIFLDMIERTDLIHHFFSIITDVTIELASKVQARQRQIGFPIDFLTVSNCTINIISPEMYRELAPCDVVMADMQAATPDARVIEFLDICRALASGSLPEGSTITKNG